MLIAAHNASSRLIIPRKVELEMTKRKAETNEALYVMYNSRAVVCAHFRVYDRYTRLAVYF